MDVTARDMPDIRTQLSQWATHTGPFGAEDYLRTLFNKHKPDPLDPDVTLDEETPDVVTMRMVTRLTAQLPASELFYVNADMTRLAHHAAGSLANYQFSTTDLPAPVGLLGFEAPLDFGCENFRYIPLVAWGPAQSGTSIHFFMPSSDLLPPFLSYLHETNTDPEPLRRRIHATTPFLLRSYHVLQHGTPLQQQVPDPRSADRSSAEVVRIIAATWLLMGQTITTTRLVPAWRPARRRAEKAGILTDAAVRYVELRRHVRPAEDPQHLSSAAKRVYRHRWIVRGHWREQWYPSQNRHRPIWISDHIAGPDDAPLLGGDRVNVLRR